MEQNKNNEEYIPLRFGNKNVPKREKTLIEIFQIIAKNKKILIATVSVFLIGALIYAFTATPLYEASATLKKESNPNDRRFGSGTDISTLLSLQSTDEIETELELIRTFKVAYEVAKELDLFVNIKEIEWNSDKNKYEIKKTFVEINDPTFIAKNSKNFRIPEKFKVKFNNPDDLPLGDYKIIKKAPNSYDLVDALSGKKISDGIYFEPKLDRFSALDTITGFTISRDTTEYFILPINDNVKVEFNWTSAPEKSEIVFTINSINSTARGVSGGIKVSRVGKTNIFNLGYSSSSAYAATIIANTVVDKYREARMEQKKETIRYSYNTVDKQLLEIQDKLRETEDLLSSFKASGQIMTIDASAQNLIGYLSRLEAEKMSIDLQLSDYKNKVADLKTQLSKTGYFDQSYLGPSTTADNTPFSELMRQLSNLELQKIELLQKRTENHPDVKAIDDQISTVRKRLSGFNENTITAYEIMINTLEKKLLKIVDMMSKYEAKLQSLPAQENKLAQILRQKATYEKIFTILLDQREAMRVAELSSPQDISIVDLAKVPNRPSWPKKQMIVMISLLLGIFSGVLLIFISELRKSKFIILDELEEEFQIPILSIIPNYSKEIKKAIETSNAEHKIALFTVNDDGLKETYRLLKTKLHKQLGPENKIIMVTSCEENSGKTTVVANLAASLASEGKKTLVIDCDLRKGELSKMFGLGNERKGLLDYLENDNPPKIFTVGSKFLNIIPAGGLSADSGALLNSSRMRLLLNSIDVTQYELIIVDTPPVTRVVDTLVLSHSIRNGILVVRPQHSLIDTVRWGMSELLNAQINIKGIVVNAANIENSYYYKHRYGYGYGYGSKNGNGKAKNQNIKQEFKLKFKEHLTNKN